MVGYWYKPKSVKPIKVAVKTLKVIDCPTDHTYTLGVVCMHVHHVNKTLYMLHILLYRMAPRRRLVKTSSPKLLLWDNLTTTMSFTCMGWCPNVSRRGQWVRHMYSLGSGACWCMVSYCFGSWAASGCTAAVWTYHTTRTSH